MSPPVAPALAAVPADGPAGLRRPDPEAGSRTSRLMVLAAAMVAALVAWSLRRPDQLLHPYVWADEYHVLNRYQSHGLVNAAVAPLKGYFAWPTSITVALGAWVSFLHLPVFEYWCATAWFVATLLLLLLPKSGLGLRPRVVMALLAVLVPVNPEVFGVALYSFWWTSLWPAITLVWAKDHWWARLPALVLGGMSSLAGSAMVLPYAIAALVGRKRRDLVASGVLAATSAAQAVAYLTSARRERTPLYAGRVAEQELRNFAYYPLSWSRHGPSVLLAVLGVAMLAFLVLATRAFPVTEGRLGSSPTTRLYGPLLGAALLMGLLSAVPSPLFTTPGRWGPRYYFLPFVLLSWLLVVIVVYSGQRWRRLLASVVILAALVGTGTNFSRHEPEVSWQAQLSRCRGATRPFYVPVQFDGVPGHMWGQALVVTPATCRAIGYQAEAPKAAPHSGLTGAAMRGPGEVRRVASQ